MRSDGARTKQVEATFSETGVDDEIIVMRLDNGEIFALSGTAAAAWRLIDGKRDRAALLAALADEFAADESEISRMSSELPGRLGQRGLIAGD